MDIWAIHFNKASNQNGFRLGNLLISPEWAHTLYQLSWIFEITNNVAEHEAYIIKLQATI